MYNPDRPKKTLSIDCCLTSFLAQISSRPDIIITVTNNLKETPNNEQKTKTISNGRCLVDYH